MRFQPGDKIVLHSNITGNTSRGRIHSVYAGWYQVIWTDKPHGTDWTISGGDKLFEFDVSTNRDKRLNDLLS